MQNLYFVALVVYFITQALLSIKTSYSFQNDQISTLGDKTRVGDVRASLMNICFVVTGLLVIIGCVQELTFCNNTNLSIGLGLMICSGLATILIGLNPVNSSHFIHVQCAKVVFLVGNLSLLFLARGLHGRQKVWGYIGCSVAVAALPLQMLNLVRYGGLVERLIAYPQTLFLIYLGFTLHNATPIKVDLN